MRSKARVAASFLFCCVALPLGIAPSAGCGEDGSAPYAGWDTAEDSGNVYRVRFLAPPWKRVPTTDGDGRIELVVPPVFGSLDAGAPPKFRLEASLVRGLALPTLQAEIARIGGALVLRDPAPFTTLSSDIGFTAVVADRTNARFYQLVTLAAPGDRALLVVVQLNEDPRNDLEVDAMLRAIDVRPFAE